MGAAGVRPASWWTSRPSAVSCSIAVDETGTLAGAVEPGTATIRLLDGSIVDVVVGLVRLLDALRLLLPIGCAVAIALTLALARYRVHALAWVGLCGVVAGTVSLLVASGGPVLVSRSTDMAPDQAAAVTAALDTITAGLVIQSAALAGLGLALVVAGIAGGRRRVAGRWLAARPASRMGPGRTILTHAPRHGGTTGAQPDTAGGAVSDRKRGQPEPAHGRHGRSAARDATVDGAEARDG